MQANHRSSYLVHTFNENNKGKGKDKVKTQVPEGYASSKGNRSSG
jgi:hypothetical protein